MSTTQIAMSGPRLINEGSSIVIAARFRDRAAFVDVVPTSINWRLDTDDGCQLQDWTSITPAASVNISIPASLSRLFGLYNGGYTGFWGAYGYSVNYPMEGRILTVEADKGLATQFMDVFRYDVRALVNRWAAA